MEELKKIMTKREWKEFSLACRKYDVSDPMYAYHIYLYAKFHTNWGASFSDVARSFLWMDMVDHPMGDELNGLALYMEEKAKGLRI